MKLSQKSTGYLIAAGSIAAIVILLLLIGEIVIPFVLAVLVAHVLNPVILKIQQQIKNRNLAVTIFWIAVVALFGITFLFLGGHIAKDTNRLVNAIEVFSEEHQATLDQIKNQVSSFVEANYNHEVIQERLESIDTSSSPEGQESLATAIESVYSLFSAEPTAEETPTTESWSVLGMLMYFIAYTVLVMYSYGYFEKKYEKYAGFIQRNNADALGLWKDFLSVFPTYFRQRGQIVLINALLAIIVFNLMGLPGALILGVIIGILSYAAHFHYLSLPLTVIGCWVLSVEQGTSIWLFLGIVVCLYLVISILEETVYFSNIMKSVNAMNPAITLLSFSLWIYVFGGFTGTIIALPLTQLIMIYLDRLLVYTKAMSEHGESENSGNNR
ncbi:MAG: AI-2E family transporter [Bacteroidota bacterium]